MCSSLTNDVKVFTNTGDFLFAIAGGGLSNPADIALTSDDAFVYVASRGTNDMKIFDASGAPVAGFSLPDGSLDPTGIRLTSDDSVLYVSNATADSIETFTATGDYLGAVVSGALPQPTDVALSSDDSLIYATSAVTRRVEVFGATGTPIRSIGGDGLLNHDCELTLALEDSVFVVTNFALQFNDCNDNGIPDECDLNCGPAGGVCELSGCGMSADCNSNAVADECDISAGTSQDCNANGMPDDCGIASGASEDCDANGTPDECEPPALSLLWVHSVAVHKVGGGLTQEFYVDMDITGDPMRRTSEPRNSGIRVLEAQFNQDVVAAVIRVIGPTGLCQDGCGMDAVPGDFGATSRRRINLGRPLPNAEVYTITVTASTDRGCDLAQDICVAALTGDFNSDRQVTAGEKDTLLGFVFQPITQFNARYDLQVNGGDSGTIEVGDVAAWVGFFGNTVVGQGCP